MKKYKNVSAVIFTICIIALTYLAPASSILVANAAKKPDVTLTQIVQPAPLLGASVSLSQIPATGVNEYSTFTIFLLGVAFWSLVILGIVFVKKLLRNRNKWYSPCGKTAVMVSAKGGHLPRGKTTGY